MKLVITLLLVVAVLGGYLYFANPGYHFTNCSCGYVFYEYKGRSDCATMCTNYSSEKLTAKQQKVNKYLLTDYISHLKNSN